MVFHALVAKLRKISINSKEHHALIWSLYQMSAYFLPCAHANTLLLKRWQFSKNQVIQGILESPDPNACIHYFASFSFFD